MSKYLGVSSTQHVHLWDKESDHKTLSVKVTIQMKSSSDLDKNSFMSFGSCDALNSMYLISLSAT